MIDLYNKESNHDEMMDLVNDEDMVIGQQPRSYFYSQGDPRFRAINAFLINSQCQVWIPNRHPNKALYPLCLDASVGGHVKAGETYEEAFAREAREELNIDINREKVYCWKKFAPYEHGLSCNMKVFFIFTSSTPDYNRDDFFTGGWYFLGTIRKKILAGAKTRSDIAILLPMIPNNESLIRFRKSIE